MNKQLRRRRIFFACSASDRFCKASLCAASSSRFCSSALLASSFFFSSCSRLWAAQSYLGGLFPRHALLLHSSHVFGCLNMFPGSLFGAVVSLEPGDNNKCKPLDGPFALPPVRKNRCGWTRRINRSFASHRATAISIVHFSKTRNGFDLEVQRPFNVAIAIAARKRKLDDSSELKTNENEIEKNEHEKRRKRKENKLTFNWTKSVTRMRRRCLVSE